MNVLFTDSGIPFNYNVWKQANSLSRYFIAAGSSFVQAVMMVDFQGLGMF